MQFHPTSELCEHGWRLESNKYHTEWCKGQVCPHVIGILEVEEADLGKLSTNLLLNNI